MLLELVITLALGASADKRAYETNPAINPCDNFYDYVCSRTIAHSPLPPDRARYVYSVDDIAERLMAAKKKYLNTLKVPKNLRQQNLKSLFGACTNTKTQINSEKGFVTKNIERIKQITSLENFLDFLGLQLSTGERFSPIKIGVTANLEEPSKNDLTLISDWLTLPDRSYYEKEELIHEFLTVVKLFFETLKEPNPQQRAESVVQFQIDVSKTSLLPVELRDRLSMKTSVTREEIEKKWPLLRLKPYLSKLKENVTIRNLSPENFTWLNDSMSKIPLPVLKDAYLFQLLSSKMDSAYPAFREKYFEFQHKHLGFPEKRLPRLEECTNFIIHHYGAELDHEMLPALFPKFPEDKILNLTDKIRQSTVKSIERASWLSEKGKKGALEKIQKAALKLIKPRAEKDWGFLPPATFSNKDSLENQLILGQLTHQKNLNCLSEPRNPDEWNIPPLTVDAYYDPYENTFILPIGILQYPFFSPLYRKEEALAAIGSVIAHELGHAIDDKGSKYNAQGQIVRWMSDEDLAKFQERILPLKRQLEKKELASHLKIGEVIGDLTGAIIAFETAFPTPYPSKEKLKSFFIHYARLHCETVNPQFAEHLAKTNTHPPGSFRVNEILSHLRGFEEAFGCKAGAVMSRKDSERIRIW